MHCWFLTFMHTFVHLQSRVPTPHPHEQMHLHIPQARVYTEEVRAGEMPQSVNCVPCKKKERQKELSLMSRTCIYYIIHMFSDFVCLFVFKKKNHRQSQLLWHGSLFFLGISVTDRVHLVLLFANPQTNKSLAQASSQCCWVQSQATFADEIRFV